MFTNTGTISFYLYSVFILISIISTVIIYRLLKKNTLESERLDKLIDFFKTVVFTTALGTVALIITDLFKEREQDVKELEYFDKYVQEVKDVNGQGRLQLSKYLSIVAPSGEMKDSWTAYYKEVQKDYDEYLKAQLELKNDTMVNITKQQSIKREENQVKVQLFENPLTNINNNDEWYIIASGDANMDDANYELKKAIKINANSKIMKKGNSYRTVLVGYSSKTEADIYLQEVKEKINKTAYIVNKNSWCHQIENSNECLICK
jgi:hypothetical protein